MKKKPVVPYVANTIHRTQVITRWHQTRRSRSGRPEHRESAQSTTKCHFRHDYTVDTLDVLKACDACADMGQL